MISATSAGGASAEAMAGMTMSSARATTHEPIKNRRIRLAMVSLRPVSHDAKWRLGNLTLAPALTPGVDRNKVVGYILDGVNG
jgi:hypothetical protein